MVAHISNPSTQDSEEGGSMSSKPAWSTYGVLSQPEHTSYLCNIVLSFKIYHLNLNFYISRMIFSNNISIFSVGLFLMIFFRIWEYIRIFIFL